MRWREDKEYELVSKMTRSFDANSPATFCQKVLKLSVLEIMLPLL
jgi:hypothetical protein